MTIRYKWIWIAVAAAAPAAAYWAHRTGALRTARELYLREAQFAEPEAMPRRWSRAELEERLRALGPQSPLSAWLQLKLDDAGRELGTAVGDAVARRPGLGDELLQLLESGGAEDRRLGLRYLSVAGPPTPERARAAFAAVDAFTARWTARHAEAYDAMRGVDGVMLAAVLACDALRDAGFDAGGRRRALRDLIRSMGDPHEARPMIDMLDE